ncbi:alcohol dehydrogenase [alpha proteobacterium U9-1i]|nr:alcohol dehydrogenase [alpha proteobacterium U9-1i]
MRAALFLRPNAPLEIEEVELLAPGPQDVLVRVTATALCQTDVSVRDGKYDYGRPMIMGHEACGVVEAIGAEVSHVKVGERVISTTAPTCGVCATCARGLSGCLKALDVRTTKRARRADGSMAAALYGLGSFADKMVVDQASVVAVDSRAPDSHLALIGCGVTTGLGAVLNRLSLSAGSSMAVIGCGGVGLAAIQGARMCGATTIVGIDPRAARREDAMALGATAVIDPDSEDVVARVRELTEGLGVDACIDGVGSPTTTTQAYDAVRRSGSVIIVGLPAQGTRLEFDAWQFFLSEKRISSSLFGSAVNRRDLPLYARFADEGKVDLGGLVSKLIKLEDVNAGLDALAAGEVVRVVVVQD